MIVKISNQINTVEILCCIIITCVFILNVHHMNTLLLYFSSPLYISTCELFFSPGVWTYPFVNHLDNHWNNSHPNFFSIHHLCKRNMKFVNTKSHTLLKVEMVKITDQMKIWLVSLRSTLEPLDQKCQYFLYAQIVNPGPIHTEIILSRKKLFSIVIIL